MLRRERLNGYEPELLSWFLRIRTTEGRKRLRPSRLGGTAVGDGRLRLVAACTTANRRELVLQDLNLQGIDLHQLTSLLRVKGVLTGPGTNPARSFCLSVEFLIQPSVAASGCSVSVKGQSVHRQSAASSSYHLTA